MAVGQGAEEWRAGHVYQHAQAVIFMVDPARRDSLAYVVARLENRGRRTEDGEEPIPPNAAVLVLVNFKDRQEAEAPVLAADGSEEPSENTGPGDEHEKSPLDEDPPSAAATLWCDRKPSIIMWSTFVSGFCSVIFSRLWAPIVFRTLTRPRFLGF